MLFKWCKIAAGVQHTVFRGLISFVVVRLSRPTTVSFSISALLFMSASLQMLSHKFRMFKSLSYPHSPKISIFFFFTIFFPHPTFLNCKHIHLTYLSWKLHEAHIGVASPKAKIATYKNFTINVSPRIKHVGELSLHILNVGGKHRLFLRHLFCIEENKITNGTKGTGSPCHICFLHLENK